MALRWAGSHFVIWNCPLEACNPFLGSVIGYQCNSCRVTCQSRNGCAWTFFGQCRALLRLKGHFQNHMKSEWLLTNVTVIRSPVSAESIFLSDFGRFFPQIQATIVVWEPLCDILTPCLEAKQPYLGSFNDYRVCDCRWNILQVPEQARQFRSYILVPTYI